MWFISFKTLNVGGRGYVWLTNTLSSMNKEAKSLIIQLRSQWELLSQWISIPWRQTTLGRTSPFFRSPLRPVNIIWLTRLLLGRSTYSVPNLCQDCKVTAVNFCLATLSCDLLAFSIRSNYLVVFQTYFSLCKMVADRWYSS